MTEENIDNGESTNANGELDLKAQVEKLQDINKKLFERAKKAEGFTQEGETWVKKPQPEAAEIINSPKPIDILRDDAFKLYREGYTEDEIDLIMRNGGRKVLEDESSPLTLGLKAAREQRNAEIAAGQTSDSSSLSEVERKYTSEQLRNMTPKELENILPKA
jgi:hypothetical protein